MATARWDITWPRGGAWQRKIVRRDRAGTILGITGPCLLEVRKIDDPSTVAPVLTLTGQPTEAGAVILTATRDEIEALQRALYQHRVLVTDARSGLPDVLARGYVSVEDRIGG